jgi:uncharacterized membrane protein YdbT with pleckstrin-like domain
MGYVDNNLLNGEVVTYRARLHWMIFAGASILMMFGVLCGVICAVAIPHEAGMAAPMCAIFVLVFSVPFMAAYSRFVSSEFAITDRRVVIKVGLLRRRTVELLLGKVETIGVDQGIFGRLFDYGTIIVTGTGGTKEPFKGISKPLEFRRQVQSRLAG